MHCTKCGKEIPEGSLFCPGCGSALGKKKMGKLKIGCLGIIGFFVFCGVVGAIFGGNSSDSNSTSSSTQSQQAKPEKKPLGIGETFKSDAFEITVTGKDVAKRLNDDSGYLYYTADGTFVVVKVHYKNISDVSKTIDHGAFQLKAGGNTYSPTNIAGRLRHSVFLQTINPGIEKDGEIYFDVPADVANGNLVLTVSSTFWSDTFNGEINLQ